MGASESKALFSENASVLLSEADPAESLYSELVRVPLTLEETFEVVTPAFVRALRESPMRLRCLLEALIKQGEDNLKEHQLSAQSLALLLSTVRLLTRIVPFLFEDSQEELFFGGNRLANKILSLTMRLLFKSGFCVSSASPPESNDLPTDRVDLSRLWVGGVGGKTLNPNFAPSMRHRIETLCLLRTLLSASLFQSIEEYKENPNPWLQEMSTGDLPFTATLFASLIGIVCSYDPIGFGVPYAGLISSDGGQQELVSISTQILAILVDFRYPEQSGEELNVFREILASISDEEEIDFLASGILNSISTVSKSQGVLLPGSSPRVSHYQELLIFLFESLLINEKLKHCVIKKGGAALTGALLTLLTESANDPTKIGLQHLCGFLILVLSGERMFGLGMNMEISTIESAFFATSNFRGECFCVGDIFIQVIINFILAPSSKSPVSDALVDLLLTSFNNVSPYIRSLSVDSALVIGNLLDKLSSAKFLLNRPRGFHSLSLFIESINSLLQYQSAGNYPLVYILLKRSAVLNHLSAEIDESFNKGKSLPAWCSSDYVLTWKQQLPMEPILRLLDGLLDVVERDCLEKEVTETEGVIELLKKHTLVGILPAPHPISVRKFQQGNQSTLSWFTSFLWGVVFVASQPLPLYDWKKVKMIIVSQAT